MKYLIYFLFLSSAVFSQNYQYAIEESQSKESNVPTNLVASQITPDSANLAWTAPTDQTSISEYQIYNNGTLLATSTGISTTFALSGLIPETAYSLTLRAVDKSSNVSDDSNIQKFTTDKINTGVNNQLEEIEYFKAYLLPLAKKATLQQALDTYGSVRLEKGDYSGVNIVMKSNQKLYGYPGSKTLVSNITIAAGSSGVLLDGLVPADKKIILQPGAVISGCTFKSIKWATLEGINVMFENNTLIDYQGPIMLNCSASGYFRNNKIIRHQSGTVSNVLVAKGNITTPSYGNVHLWSNFLTPHGDTTDINNLTSATFVGLDSESWNYTNKGTKAMFYAQNMGNVKIADLNGGSSSPYKTPALDIDATDLFLYNRVLADPTDILSLRTNVFLVGGTSETYTRKAGTVTGFDLLGDAGNNQVVKYNGVEVTAPISNTAIITKISNTILGTKQTPWARPSWNTVPDPLGTTWATDRKGKPDSRAYIQNLINTNRIAELPQGIYYIGSTLLVPADGNHGIVGKGTGETVICGLTDDFPLISIKGGYGVDGNIVLSYLTLQGGNTGFYASTVYGGLNIAYQSMKFVVFRNQVNAIHIDKTGGFDNNFFENIAFINCSKGFYQQPTAGNSGEDNSAYVDKTTFYKSQFINCNTAISMRATRANNLNAWIDCKFDGGNVALDLANNNAPIIANCEIKNYSGTNVIISNTISIYNTNVHNNNVSNSTLSVLSVNIEGCNFLDNNKMFSPILYNSMHHHIANSTITGDAVVKITSGQGYYPQYAIFSNSSLLANPTFSKLLVNAKNAVPTVIINKAPNPYPQFLVTQ